MMLRYEVSPLDLINLLFFYFVIEGLLSPLGERLKSKQNLAKGQEGKPVSEIPGFGWKAHKVSAIQVIKRSALVTPQFFLMGFVDLYIGISSDHKLHGFDQIVLACLGMKVP